MARETDEWAIQKMKAEGWMQISRPEFSAPSSIPSWRPSVILSRRVRSFPAGDVGHPEWYSTKDLDDRPRV